MYAIVTCELSEVEYTPGHWNKTHCVSNVQLAETREKAVEHAVALAADLGMMNDRFDEKEAEEVKLAIEKSSYQRGKYEIAIMRAFKA